MEDESKKHDQPGDDKGQKSLLNDDYPHFFNCEIVPPAFKNDVGGMDVPLFTLKTKGADTEILEWKSPCGKHYLQVIPSVKGRATQLDKDLLIYAISQLTEGMNQNKIEAESGVVRFRIYDFLKATHKNVGGTDYNRVKEMLERLRGTVISTSIKTGKSKTSKGFGLIESWEIVESGPDGMIFTVEMKLSEWIANSIRAREVLTINPKYFQLKKPIERKLYEIARKYCGNNPSFKISLAILQERVGSTSTAKEFKRQLKEISEADNMPDYRYEFIEGENGMVMILNTKGN